MHYFSLTVPVDSGLTPRLRTAVFHVLHPGQIPNKQTQCCSGQPSSWTLLGPPLPIPCYSLLFSSSRSPVTYTTFVHSEETTGDKLYYPVVLHPARSSFQQTVRAEEPVPGLWEDCWSYATSHAHNEVREAPVEEVSQRETFNPLKPHENPM